MKSNYWRNVFKGMFLNLTFLLLVLNSSTLYSGGDKIEDDSDSTSSASNTVSGTNSLATTQWGKGSYSNPRAGHKDTAHMGGRIEAQFSVEGKSGGAQYTIPLKVLKGHKGMEPKLTLAYSSGAGNGVYGLGWNVVGIPSVIRCGTNKKFEGDQINKYKYTCTKYRTVSKRGSCQWRNWWGTCQAYNYYDAQESSVIWRV